MINVGKHAETESFINNAIQTKAFFGNMQGKDTDKCENIPSSTGSLMKNVMIN